MRLQNYLSFDDGMKVTVMMIMSALSLFPLLRTPCYCLIAEHKPGVFDGKRVDAERHTRRHNDANMTAESVCED